jgi:hypothetical protein
MQPTSMNLHALFAFAFVRLFDVSNRVDMGARFDSHSHFLFDLHGGGRSCSQDLLNAESTLWVVASD